MAPSRPTVAVLLLATVSLAEGPPPEYTIEAMPGDGRTWVRSIADGRALGFSEEKEEGVVALVVDRGGRVQRLGPRNQLRKLSPDGGIVVGSTDQILKRKDGIYWRTWQAIRIDENGYRFLSREYVYDHDALDVNTEGQVVGRARDEKGRLHPVLWTDEGIRWLEGPEPAKPILGEATAIAESGLVGITLLPPEGGKAGSDLPALVFDPAKGKYRAIAVEGAWVLLEDLSHGTAVGVLATPKEPPGDDPDAKPEWRHAPFVFDVETGRVERLPTGGPDGGAFARKGKHVVGLVETEEDQRAVRWRRTEDGWALEDLNDLAAPVPKGWYLRRAIDISPDGSIAVEGRRADDPKSVRGFLLWPR